MHAHVLGFPRIGPNRELKWALERFWKGANSESELLEAAAALMKDRWATQDGAGLTIATVGDFSLYDHVLDTTTLLGVVPDRFGSNAEKVDLGTYFHMARGDASRDVAAMEMTKWFDTNYHYLVPEFREKMNFRLASDKLLGELRLCEGAANRPAKAVLLGPVTYVALGKEMDGSNRWKHLDAIVAVYEQLLRQLGDRVEWIQIDEPILVTPLEENARSAFAKVYDRLRAAAGAKLLLAVYFGPLRENLDLALSLPCDALHIDLVRGPEELDAVVKKLPSDKALSAGVVNGRSIWKTHLGRAIELLQPAMRRLGPDRLMIGSSCSLLHSPVDVASETALSASVRRWMAFAVQKCREIRTIRDALLGVDVSFSVEENAADYERWITDPDRTSAAVRRRVDAVARGMYDRGNPYSNRNPLQRDRLGLPLLPTTTIGSFPQTAEIRKHRLEFKKGACSEEEYESFLREEIENTIREQETLDLDVLVHGEPERNDMVEYFGQQLEGFCFTKNGWVQSYGSRCVKPPVIYGDVSRPEPMTVRWIRHAQSCTKRPVKGMLTGPVTILCWSFVRDDLSREEVCRQIALAIRDEVADLEKAGVPIIQIDEAAFREGMPLKPEEADDYLRWAVDCFRLSTAVAGDATQIHTHMCYSEFNSIVQWIVAMDADVISVEAARSKMELLDAFQAFEYPNEIGPGVYDIHSPRVPPAEEMAERIRMAAKVVPAERLWVNPDCGLKTRGWAESRAALANMVAAAKEVREELTAGGRAR